MALAFAGCRAVARCRSSTCIRHHSIVGFPISPSATSRIASLHSSVASQRRPLLVRRAFEHEEQNNQNKEHSLDEFVEVKVEHVKIQTGNSVVFLKVLDQMSYVIPVHIGESESNALMKEMNKQKQSRPLTHDLAKSIILSLGYRVSEIRITEIQSNTYFARIFLRPTDNSSLLQECEVDSRPSDALNLAIRFGAPMYVRRSIAEAARAHMSDMFTPPSESSTDIVRTVRETLANYEDPTLIYQLQLEMAVKDQKFEEAARLRECIVHEMTHNRQLQLVVAMEAALQDHRFEEAARLRDQFMQMYRIQD